MYGQHRDHSTVWCCLDMDYVTIIVKEMCNQLIYKYKPLTKRAVC